MPYTVCPACSHAFHYDPALSGLVVDCPGCGVELREPPRPSPYRGLAPFVVRVLVLVALVGATAALFVVMLARVRADDPLPVRKDLVAAVRKKAGLEKADYEAKEKELADTLKSAKAGVINPALDAKTRKPRRLGTDPFAFRSLKIRDEFVADAEAAATAHGTLAEDVVKDLRKYVGIMGRPGTDAVGHLDSGKKLNVVERVVDDKTLAVLVPYTVVVVGSDRKPVTEVRQERLILAGIPTAKYAERRGYDFDAVWFVGGTVDYRGERVLRAEPVILSDAEKLLVRGK